MSSNKNTPSILTNEIIIEGFQNKDPKIIKKIYIDLRPMIIRMVENNRGTKNDAKDIFQEALMVLFTKIKRNELKLTCSFKTFLYSICRNIWLNQLRNRKIYFQEFQDNEVFVEISNNKKLLKEIFINKEYLLFRDHYKNLPNEQQRLINLFINKFSFKEIADIMKFKNAAIARKKKMYCKNQLIENIKNDPKYLELKNMQEVL